MDLAPRTKLLSGESKEVDRATLNMIYKHVPISLGMRCVAVKVTSPTVETTSITTTARRSVTNHSNQERMMYIVTGHSAELLHTNQPSIEDIITANAGEDMIKENGIEEVTNPTTRVLIKTTSDCDLSSFATLDRLGGYGDTQV